MIEEREVLVFSCVAAIYMNPIMLPIMLRRGQNTRVSSEHGQYKDPKGGATR